MQSRIWVCAAARARSKTTEQSRQPKDKNYNLLSALYQAADNVEMFKSYIEGANEDGDQEVVELFDAILENNLRASQQLKELLVSQLESEQDMPKTPS